MRDDRLERVRELLAREGLEADLSVAGAEAEIVAIRAAPARRESLAALAPGIRALGFRYVTIEVEARDP
jgi:hypothetical protein